MRTPTLEPLSALLRRGTVLAILSFALAAGLTGCAGAGPTEPGVADPSGDPSPVPLHRLTFPLAAARTSTEISRTVVLSVCPIWRWTRGQVDSSAAGVRICERGTLGARR
jgi:hypothetical protein